MLPQSRRLECPGRAFHCCLVLCLFGLLSPIGLLGQDSERERKSLEGLSGVVVVVSSDQVVEDAGYRQARMRTDVELRLRESGIRVLSPGEGLAAEEGYPVLRVRLGAFQNGPSMTYIVHSELRQYVILIRDSELGLVQAATWSTTTYGITGWDRSRESMSEAVRDVVEVFINAYLSVNPH